MRAFFQDRLSSIEAIQSVKKLYQKRDRSKPWYSPYLIATVIWWLSFPGAFLQVLPFAYFSPHKSRDINGPRAVTLWAAPAQLKLGSKRHTLIRSAVNFQRENGPRAIMAGIYCRKRQIPFLSIKSLGLSIRSCSFCEVFSSFSHVDTSGCV